jgi:hypothetical protein
MERGVGKPLFYDGTNYPYWKIRISAYLQSISYRVWEICLDAIFDATVTPRVLSPVNNDYGFKRGISVYKVDTKF